MTAPAPRTLSLGLVLVAAGGCFALTMGARQSMGLFLGPINTHTGLGLASISLAFAFGQLWWGLTQPFAGMVADRIGAGRVIFCGVLLVAAGTALVPHMTTTAGLIFAIGVLAAGGAGLAGPSVLMAAAARLISPAQRGMASGLVNAGGSFGQFVFAPLAQGVTVGCWMDELAACAGRDHAAGAASRLVAARQCASLVGAGAGRGPAAGRNHARGGVACAGLPQLPLAVRRLLRLRVPRLVLATHLPGVVASCQLSPAVGAWALGTIGLFNIVGSVGIGWLMSYRGGRWRLKTLLTWIYAARAAAVLVFLLSPKTEAVMLVFAAVMGLTYLSTVPPTVGLVAKFFGPSHMATLYGVAILIHQIGAFFGAYLGGKAFEWTGSYDWMWCADILLAVGAALVNLPIREERVVPAAAVASAR